MLSLFDGIVTPENMLRCAIHTTSIIGFWKYWHSSFNLWNIRYIYIPLGGNKHKYKYKQFCIIILVFIFTTLWHGDFNIKLLIWGSLMSLLIIPEILTKQYYYYTNNNKLIIKYRNNTFINRHIHFIGSVINIWILCIANLIGFGPGYYVTFQILSIIFSKWIGLIAILYASLNMYAAVILMNMSDYYQLKGYGWNTVLSIKTDDKIHKKT